MKKVSDILKVFRNRVSDLIFKLNEIYGDADLTEERIGSYIMLLEKFSDKFGDREVVISRSPGRVNIMGRHIDHRGGCVNSAAVSRETVVAVSPRDDDIVRISNIDSKFKDYEFSVSEIISLSDEKDWLRFIESEKVSEVIAEYKGQWVNYVKSPIIRMQYEYPQKKIKGMDIMVYGNIPPAAGLSSSSSIVVAIMEAIVRINNLDIKDDEFIRLCGEGEWYVGARGGAGDHAAMKYGKKGHIAKIGFCPVNFMGRVSFSDDYRIIVANSFVVANKSAGAKNTYNRKVASYAFGVMYIKKKYQQYSDKIIHLRDINCENLGVSENEILKMLLSVPEKVTPEELLCDLPEFENEIKQLWNSHDLPEFYEIRSVMLYGISECERAKKCAECLENSDFDLLGGMMKVSHDGDRVFSGEEKYDYSYPDKTMEKLIAENKSLWEIPGGYACSVKEIDTLVDLVCDIDGVVGAEISGAGLGGCMVIICKSSVVEDVMNSLKENYYEKRGYESGAYVYLPIEGSGILEV